jgi:tetratricopeptide (TPR) repeat protein
MPRRSKRPQKAPQPKPERAAAPAPAPAPAPARDAPAPRFWFGFTLPWAKVALVRVALFGVLAVDAFLAVRHAARYGTGFNVAHFHFLDGLAPGRAAFTLVELALAYLFALFALGVGLRLLPLAAALYGWVYFSSQLDSYQHHYLVCLVLVLACFAPWRRPPETPPDEPARSWALRLVLVQLGVVYIWAAIAKMNGAWLDGTALHQQISTPWMARILDGVSDGWAIAACATLALELFLSVAVWCRPLWWLALPLGVAFHVNIELSGLEIGLFTYVMVALYTLTVPDPIVDAATRACGNAWRAIAAPVRRAASRLGEWPLIAPAIAAVAFGSAFLVALVPFAPLLIAVTIALGVVVGAIVARVGGGPDAAARALAASLAAALLLVGLDHTTTIARDYYKYWGRSARLLGDADDEREAYDRLLELRLDPGSPTAHYFLGLLDAKAGQLADARAHWEAAEAIRPSDLRAFAEEAKLLVRFGLRDEALVVAHNALAANPSSKQARDLVDAVQKDQLGGWPSPAQDDAKP